MEALVLIGFVAAMQSLCTFLSTDSWGKVGKGGKRRSSRAQDPGSAFVHSRVANAVQRLHGVFEPENAI